MELLTNFDYSSLIFDCGLKKLPIEAILSFSFKSDTLGVHSPFEQINNIPNYLLFMPFAYSLESTKIGKYVRKENPITFRQFF